MRWKIKLNVRANFSWPSLKETFEKCRQTKNINSQFCAFLQTGKVQGHHQIFSFTTLVKYFWFIFVLIFYFSVFVAFFSRIAHSTSCSLIQLLKSHSREIHKSLALLLNATGGSSSLMEMNAVDQWQLRLLCTTIGHLGILICFITDHLRDTVKTFHRAGLLWSYG